MRPIITGSKGASEIDFQSVIARINRESSTLNYWSDILRIPLQMSIDMADSIKLLPEKNVSENNLSNSSIALCNLKAGLQDLKSGALSAAETLGKSTLDPVKELIRNYQNKIDEVQEKGNVIIEYTHKLHKEAEEHKSSYVNMQKNLDKLLESKNESISEIQELKESISKSKEKYANYAKAANKEIEEKHEEYKALISEMHDMERTKIEFLKYVLTQNAASLQLLGKLFISKSHSLSSHLQSIDTEAEIEMFNKECTSECANFALIELCAIENGNSHKNRKVKINVEAKSAEDIRILFEQTFEDLRQGAEMSLDEKAYFAKLLNTQENRKLFAEKLRDSMIPFSSSSLPAFKTLGYLVNYMLSRCVLENNKDHFIISTSLRAGSNIMFKVYLLLNIG